MDERRRRHWAERQAPQVGMRVQHVKVARTFHRPAEIHPFAELPIIEGAFRPVRSRQGRDQSAVALGTGAAKHRDLMTQASKLARKQPDERLHTTTGFATDRR